MSEWSDAGKIGTYMVATFAALIIIAVILCVIGNWLGGQP